MINWDQTASALEAALDGVRVSPTPASAREGRRGIVLHPTTTDQVAACVHACRTLDLGVHVVGGSTSLRTPRDACRTSVDLSTEGLQSFEHDEDDLVVTIGAGMTLDAATKRLAPTGQQLPLLVPSPTIATIGGAIACGADGPLRHPFGQTRDQVLGLEVVHGDGRITKAGGRVVKNVTGYDLCRLYTGSRGSLAILTRITLRLRPIPRHAAQLVWDHPSTEAALLHAQTIRRHHPALMTLHVRSEGKTDGTAQTLAMLAGDPAFVDALSEDLRPTSPIKPRLHDADLASRLPDTQHGWLRIWVRPGDLIPLHQVLATRLPPGSTITCDGFTGLCDVTHPDAQFLDPVNETALGADLVPLHAVVDRPNDPEFHLRRFHLFPSSRPGGLELMGRVIKAYDPDGFLNPGRFEVIP